MTTSLYMYMSVYVSYMYDMHEYACVLCLYVRTYVYVHVHVYVYIYICMCVSIIMYTCKEIYIYIYATPPHHGSTVLCVDPPLCVLDELEVAANDRSAIWDEETEMHARLCRNSFSHWRGA